MTAKERRTKESWTDPDDAPELTPELAQRAQISVEGSVVREASGTVKRRGRPPAGSKPKQQVTLRVAPELLRAMRTTGPGWQVRAEAVLRRQFVDGALARAEADLTRAHERALGLRSKMKSAAEVASAVNEPLPKASKPKSSAAEISVRASRSITRAKKPQPRKKSA